MVIISKGKKTIFNISFRSLRTEITLLLIAVGVVSCVATYFGIMSTYESRTVAARMEEVKEQSLLLSNRISRHDFLVDYSSDFIIANMEQFVNVYRGQVKIIDHEFQVQFDTGVEMAGHTIRDDSIAESIEEGVVTEFYDRLNRRLIVTTPIFCLTGDEVEGVLWMAATAEQIARDVRAFQIRGISVLGVVFALVLGLSLLVSHIILSPIRKVTESLEAVSEGNETEIFPINNYVEIQKLSTAYNEMINRLQVVENSRQEFVSNVSHELKTPLTSMKVLADSLLAREDVPIEIYREFLSDITAEIDRENAIITDLLSMVKLDKATPDLNIERVDVNKSLERILKRLRPIAEQRQVELRLESFRPIMAEIDEVKVTLAISNLVENAIKYNHVGGWVHISLNGDFRYFYINVSDSGIGIPEEEHGHIYERFYRLDKSHSNENQGTGLGLSIARNVVIMHRGSIKLYSKEGEGATFTVRIPLMYVRGVRKG